MECEIAMSDPSILEKYKEVARSFNGHFTYKGDTILITIDKEKLRPLSEILYWKMDCYHRTCAGSDERKINGYFAL